MTAGRRREGSREPIHCHHRSRIEDAEGGRERRVPARLSLACRVSAGRYSVLSDFRPASRRPSWASTCPSCWIAPKKWCNACMPSVPIGENPGVDAWASSSGRRTMRGRNKLTIVTSPGFGGPRRLARTAGCGINRQGRKRHHSGGPRKSLASPERYGQDRLFVYVRHTAAPDSRQDRGRGGNRTCRPSCRAHRRRGPVRYREGVLPLGVCDGRGRCGHRHSSVRPARRGGKQGRNAEADERVRA